MKALEEADMAVVLDAHEIQTTTLGERRKEMTMRERALLPKFEKRKGPSQLLGGQVAQNKINVTSCNRKPVMCQY